MLGTESYEPDPSPAWKKIGGEIGRERAAVHGAHGSAASNILASTLLVLTIALCAVGIRSMHADNS